MNETILDRMGGERKCVLCGYVEREVYRLFCPRCMQRDRLSALTTAEDTREALSDPLNPSGLNPVKSVSIP